MFGIWRRRVAPAIVTLFVPAVLTLTASSARAGDLDNELHKDTLFGSQPKDLTVTLQEADDTLQGMIDEVEKIWPADYHPETDRWTERNNRIKITFYPAILFWAGNLRVENNIEGNIGVGLRVSWEVPGFIGIRLDNTLVPFTYLRVRDAANALDKNGDHHRSIPGFVDLTSLSIAIFNPELSFAPNLAMWAGFGVDWINYHYSASAATAHYEFIDYNFGGNFFFDLEYKITDIFHIGFEWKEHIVYAPQTERGEFYHVDLGNGGFTPGVKHSRNNAIPVSLSTIEEFQLHISVLF